jgi:hypothetical protein
MPFWSVIASFQPRLCLQATDVPDRGMARTPCTSHANDSLGASAPSEGLIHRPRLQASTMSERLYFPVEISLCYIENSHQSGCTDCGN